MRSSGTCILLLAIQFTLAARSAPSQPPHHIQSFAEIVAGITEPLNVPNCQEGTFDCDMKTAESYHVVAWIFALIGMSVLALLLISYCAAFVILLWHYAE
jgi:hypothetical protein